MGLGAHKSRTAYKSSPIEFDIKFFDPKTERGTEKIFDYPCG